MAVQSEGLQRTIARDDVSLKISGAETASTTQPGTELGDKTVMNLTVDVTAFAGTSPTLLITIEASSDGFTWFTAGLIGSDGYRMGSLGTTPANFTTTGTVRALIPAARYVRSKSTIAGTTPSFTYSVGGNAA